jgi:hypothetical protein
MVVVDVGICSVDCGTKITIEFCSNLFSLITCLFCFHFGIFVFLSFVVVFVCAVVCYRVGRLTSGVLIDVISIFLGCFCPSKSWYSTFIPPIGSVQLKWQIWIFEVQFTTLLKYL